MNSNNPIITALLFIAAIMSTVGYIKGNQEKSAPTEVELVINVKEVRTEVTQDQAFDLLLGKGKGGVKVELDGEGRYWVIETNKEGK